VPFLQWCHSGTGTSTLSTCNHYVGSLSRFFPDLWGLGPRYLPMPRREMALAGNEGLGATESPQLTPPFLLLSPYNNIHHKANLKTLQHQYRPMDSPDIDLKRYGKGICWEYLDKGSCACHTKHVGSHPKLVVSSASAVHATQSSIQPSSGVIATMPKHIPQWIDNLEYLGFTHSHPHNFAVLTTDNIPPPQAERDEMKTRGASFSPGMKKWIVPAKVDLGKFAKWHPIVDGYGVHDVVMYNEYVDVENWWETLVGRGFFRSQLDVKGINNAAVEVNDTTGGTTTYDKKRQLDNDESSQATTNRKRRIDTDEQLRMRALLSSTKGALLRCNMAGSVSKEQHQFNKSIFQVVEALAKSESRREEANNAVGSTDVIDSTTSAVKGNPKCTGASPLKKSHVAPVTPATQQKKSTGESSPGIPGTWYHST
jgi:hypothetical protein